MQATSLAALLLSVFIGVSGCSDQQHFNFDKRSATGESVEAAPGTDLAEERPQHEANINLERKLIKEGHVTFETSDIAATSKIVAAAAQNHTAYISSEQESKEPGRTSITMVVRVPSAQFDSFLAAATSGVYRFDHKQIEVKDVTEEYLDIEARLKTKKELEARYMELLKKAKSVKEILEIEQYISQHRADIESIEGRLKFLQSQVSYSTLTLTFYQEFSKSTEFGNKFKDAFRNGWENLVWFFVVLANLWPFLLIGIGVLVAVKLWRRKR